MEEASMKLFVGNLPHSVSDTKLRELFEPFGEISEAVVIKDKFSGRSKGFGFVTFAEGENAKKAMAEMNGKEIEGRQVNVNEARPMTEDRPRRSSSSNFNRRRF
jgi:RNA recognition motif-containing protein